MALKVGALICLFVSGIFHPLLNHVSPTDNVATGTIAYVRSKEEGKDIMVMNPDGTKKRVLVSDGSYNLFPKWSHDGSTLAYLSDRTGTWKVYFHLCREDVDVQFLASDSFMLSPEFSSDGRQLLFPMRIARGYTNLFISNPDGTGHHNVTNSPSTDLSPTWAPSGMQFAFVSDRNQNGTLLFVSDLNGKNTLQIGKSGGDADSPAWCPDGRRIAFQWRPRQDLNYDIYVIDVKTGELTQLTHGQENSGNPSWSPNGTFLAIHSTNQGVRQIFVMRADGSGVRQLTTEGNNANPCWGP